MTWASEKDSRTLEVLKDVYLVMRSQQVQNTNNSPLLFYTNYSIATGNFTTSVVDYP